MNHYCLVCGEVTTCTDGAHCNKCFHIKNAGLLEFCKVCPLKFLCATGTELDTVVQEYAELVKKGRARLLW